MTYDEMGMRICDFINTDGTLSTEECLNRAIFYINEGKKREQGVEELNTRNIPDLIQLVQSIPGGIQYTDMVLIIGAIKVLTDFSLKLVEKMKDDKENK